MKLLTDCKLNTANCHLPTARLQLPYSNLIFEPQSFTWISGSTVN